MSYRIEFRPAARRGMRRLPRDVIQRIDRHILSLADDPRPHGVERLTGEENTYRIRVGDYRVLYEIHDDVLIVYVIRVGHRRDVYR